MTQPGHAVNIDVASPNTTTDRRQEVSASLTSFIGRELQTRRNARIDTDPLHAFKRTVRGMNKTYDRDSPDQVGGIKGTVNDNE